MPAFPTLSRKPSFPLDPDGDLEDVVLRTPSEAGYVSTRPRTTRSRRKYGLNYTALSSADETALRDFERVTLRNGADAFTWIHPLSGSTHTVRLQGPIRWGRPRPAGTDASFVVVEV